MKDFGQNRVRPGHPDSAIDPLVFTNALTFLLRRSGVLGGLVGLASVPSAIGLAILFSNGLQVLYGPGDEAEFRVGNLAFGGGNKAGDVVLVLSFWLFVGVIAVFAQRYFSKRTPDFGIQVFIFVQLGLTILLALGWFFGVAGSLMGPHTPILFIILSQFLVALGFYFGRFLSSRERGQLSRREEEKLGEELSWLLVLAGSWLPVGGLVVFLRWVGIIGASGHLLLPWLLFALSGLLVLFLTLGRHKWSAGRSLSFLRGWVVSLYGLPTMFLLLPPLLKYGETMNRIPGIQSRYWALALGLVGLFIVVETIGRYFWATKRDSPRGFYSSVAVAVFAVSLRSGGGVPQVSADDYHFGEVFSPSYFFLRGEIDDSPLMARGPVANLLPGLLNEILFNGQASTLAFTQPVIALLIVSAVHIALRAVIGSFPATLVAFIFGFANHYVEADLFAVTMAFVAMRLLLVGRNSFISGVGTGFFLMVSIVGYPLMGLAGSLLVLGVFALGVLGAVVARETQTLMRLLRVGLVASGFLALVAFSDPTRQLVKSINYVISQGRGNAQSYGIPLDLTLRQPLALEFFVTFSFGIAVVVSLVLIYFRARLPIKFNSDTLVQLGLLAVPAIFVVGLSGRFLGRIDPSMVSFRPLAGSLLTIGLVLPIALLLSRYGRAKIWAIGFLGLAIVMSIVVTPPLSSNFQRSLAGSVYQPTSWDSAEVAQSVPSLGLGVGTDTHLSELTVIAEVSESLKGFEVENLSQRNSLNAYFEWGNSGPYLAPYNIPGTSEEEREIRALEAAMPGVLFLGPGTWWDGLSMTLRTPRLANWVMQNYSPVECAGTHWAISVERERFGKYRFPSFCTFPLGPEEHLSSWGDFIGAPENLGLIPHSWGRNQGEIVFVEELSFHEDMANQANILSATVRSSNRGQSDFLVLEVKCEDLGAPSPQRFIENPDDDNSVTIRWKQPGSSELLGESSSAWGLGSFAFPLFAYPGWRSKIHEDVVLEILFTSNGCDSGWLISGQLGSN